MSVPTQRAGYRVGGTAQRSLRRHARGAHLRPAAAAHRQPPRRLTPRPLRPRSLTLQFDSRGSKVNDPKKAAQILAAIADCVCNVPATQVRFAHQWLNAAVTPRAPRPQQAALACGPPSAALLICWARCAAAAPLKPPS